MRPFRFLGFAAAVLTCAAFGAGACGNEEAEVRPRLDGSALGDGGELEGSIGCGVAIPQAYDASTFAANTVVEAALVASLAALDAKMASTEGNTPTTVTAAELAAIYKGGNPSLFVVSTLTSQGSIDGYLTAFGNAQGKTWEPADAQDGGVTTGGKYAGLFYESATGLDIRAAASKALLGGALYNQAITVANGMSPAAVDRLLALYGASTALANRTDVDAGAAIDSLVAALASKRDNDGAPTGIYRQMRTAILTMQATAANPACKADLDAALAAYFLGWEQATYASAIFSLNAAVTSAQNPQSNALTLHSFGEAIGLIESFKGLPNDKRKISDAQIDLVLGKIRATTPYELITAPGARSPDIESAISDIALYEGFDAAAVASFKQSF